MLHYIAQRGLNRIPRPLNPASLHSQHSLGQPETPHHVYAYVPRCQRIPHTRFVLLHFYPTSLQNHWSPLRCNPTSKVRSWIGSINPLCKLGQYFWKVQKELRYKTQIWSTFLLGNSQFKCILVVHAVLFYQPSWSPLHCGSSRVFTSSGTRCNVECGFCLCSSCW